MATDSKIPRFRKRRVTRIRTELGLWLAERHGSGARYDRAHIDLGREELGFDSVDDALIAYTFFGAEFVPEYLAVIGLADFQSEIESVLDSIVDGVSAEFIEEIM